MAATRKFSGAVSSKPRVKLVRFFPFEAPVGFSKKTILVGVAVEAASW